MKRLFLGNLPYNNYESEDLRADIEVLGVHPTDVKVVTDPATGVCRGFGFAEFATDKDAADALDILKNGGTAGGRPMRADWATERAGGGPRSGGGGGGGSNYRPPRESSGGGRPAGQDRRGGRGHERSEGDYNNAWRGERRRGKRT